MASTLNRDIERFLAATDLDLAVSAFEALTEISRDDAAALVEVVVSWSNAQAVANMLMHPAIIPAPYRVPSLLRGLATDFRRYPSVAAIVGLRKFDMPDEYRRAVATRLVELAATDAEPVSSLASVTLGEYLLEIDTGEVLARYDDCGDTARHNVLVGLIDALGVDDVRSHVELARSNYKIRGATADEIGESLGRLQAQGGGMYLLVPIPNLDEWDARPAVAGYPGA